MRSFCVLFNVQSNINGIFSDFGNYILLSTEGIVTALAKRIKRIRIILSINICVRIVIGY